MEKKAYINDTPVVTERDENICWPECQEEFNNLIPSTTCSCEAQGDAQKG